MEGSIEIAPWPKNRRFAYSITYDEGFVEVLGFAWRLHRDYGVPGHVNVHPGLLGQLEGDSSAGFLQSLWNLRKYAEPAQLRWLIEQGWTIGCQYGGQRGSAQDRDALAAERRELETCVGAPVASLAFADGSTWVANADAAREAGYRWLMPWHDELNPAAGSGAAGEDGAGSGTVADDLGPGGTGSARGGLIRRSPLYHLGPTPNHLANDPYRLLAQASDRGGWVVDVVRSVERYPADPARDCTPGELERRFRAVHEIGQGAEWLANVDAAAAYRARRAAVRLEPAPSGDGEIVRTVRVAPGSEASDVALTFLVTLDDRQAGASQVGGKELRPASTPHPAPRAYAGDVEVELDPGGQPGSWQLTCAVAEGQRLRIAWGGTPS